MDYSFVEFFIVSRSYEYVVHVNEDASWVPGLERGENPIHAPLEHSGSVGHAKEHTLGFIMAAGPFERQFPMIFGLHSDVVVAVPNVKSSEDCFTMQLLQNEVDPRHWIHIPLCPFVHIAIVLHKSKTSILFVDEEDRATPWRLTVLNLPQGLVFGHELVPFFKFCPGKWVYFVIQRARGSWL